MSGSDERNRGPVSAESVRAAQASELGKWWMEVRNWTRLYLLRGPMSEREPEAMHDSLWIQALAALARSRWHRNPLGRGGLQDHEWMTTHWAFWRLRRPGGSSQACASLRRARLSRTCRSSTQSPEKQSCASWQHWPRRCANNVDENPVMVPEMPPGNQGGCSRRTSCRRVICETQASRCKNRPPRVDALDLLDIADLWALEYARTLGDLAEGAGSPGDLKSLKWVALQWIERFLRRLSPRTEAIGAATKHVVLPTDGEECHRGRGAVRPGVGHAGSHVQKMWSKLSTEQVGCQAEIAPLALALWTWRETLCNACLFGQPLSRRSCCEGKQHQRGTTWQVNRERPNRVQTQLQFTVGHSSFSTEPGTTAQTKQNTVETEQVQLLNKVVVLRCHSLCHDKCWWSRQCSEVQQLKFIDKVIEIPVLMQRQITVVQTIRKTFSNTLKWNSMSLLSRLRKVPQAQVVQTQFIDRAANVPSVTQKDRCRLFRKSRRLLRYRRRTSFPCGTW